MFLYEFRWLAVPALLCVLCCEQSSAGVLVTVGDVNNAADASGYGAVGYQYQISATEVTNSEYTAFLNAVAATDTHGLYNANMASTLAGITQSGVSGGFTYAVSPGRGDHPVVYVSFYDTLRYTNWLENGMVTGGQNSGTTEDGSYTITAGGITNNNILRNVDSTWFLPSEDEWYKAAYYDPVTASYFNTATSSNVIPTDEAPAGGSNSANFNDFIRNSTAVGAYTSALSPYGTFDQSGNVYEWNEAIIEESGRTFRGGYWGSNSSVTGEVTSSFRKGLDPSQESFLTGFRVGGLASQVAVPEPGSLGVCGLICVTGFFLRKSRTST